MRTLVAVMIAGSLGAAARYGVDGWVSDRLAGQFPWGTLVVNATGCLILGFLATVLTGRFTVDPALRTGMTVGFVGAYTTFSTLAFETEKLAEGGSYALATVNLAGSCAAGLVAVGAGILLGRLV